MRLSGMKRFIMFVFTTTYWPPSTFRSTDYLWLYHSTQTFCCLATEPVTIISFSLSTISSKFHHIYTISPHIRHIFTLRWCIAPWSLHWQVTTVKSWSWRKSWLFKQPMKWWEKRTFRQRKGCSNNNTGKPTSTWRNASAPFPVCLSIWVTDSQMFAY